MLSKAYHFSAGDPWKEATLSSDLYERDSTPTQPINLSDGFHCSDLLLESAVDSTVGDVMKAGVKAITEWLAEWPGPDGKSSLPQLQPNLYNPGKTQKVMSPQY